MGSELRLREDDESLVCSCLLAHEDPDVKLIEQDWNELRDAIAEPWSGEV
jgi:hypothetical protein